MPLLVRADVGARQIHRALTDILLANESGVRERSRHRVPPRLPRCPASYAIAARSNPRRVPRCSCPTLRIRVLVDWPADRPAARSRRAPPGPQGPIEDVDARDLRALTTVLEDARRREQVRLDEALPSARYRRLLSEWQTFLNRPSDASGTANGARPLADVISERAWRLSRRIARDADAVDGRSTADELHAVRIAAKKLRYLVDVTPGFYDAADLEHILVALKKLQRCSATSTTPRCRSAVSSIARTRSRLRVRAQQCSSPWGGWRSGAASSGSARAGRSSTGWRGSAIARRDRRSGARSGRPGRRDCADEYRSGL